MNALGARGLTSLTEVFRTENGIISQACSQCCFYVEFEGTSFSFSVRSFFAFKKQIESIDVEVLLQSPSAHADLEIIFPSGTDRCLVLTIPQILELKELLQGAKAMLELNSILHNSFISNS